MTPKNPPEPAPPRLELDSPLLDSLRAAGHALAEEVRRDIPHGTRPVFLYYLAQTFTLLDEELARGLRPAADTPARQLCLHLMIDRADGTRALRTSLLPNGIDPALVALRPVATASRHHFDFTALGTALAPHGMSVFFAPFEPDDLVA